jgi:hypothetical protein
MQIANNFSVACEKKKFRENEEVFQEIKLKVAKSFFSQFHTKFYFNKTNL